MSYLYLVRHGATDWNQDGTPDSPERIRSRADVPLNEKGIQQAQDVGEQLKNKPIAYVYHDGLSRTHDTATQIGHSTGAEVQQHPGLSDWNLGHLIGQTVDQAVPTIKHYVKHPDEPVPGGEAYNTWLDRFTGGLHDLLQQTNSSPHDIAAVLHGRNFTALEHVLSDGERPIDEASKPDNAGIVPIRVARDRFAVEKEL